MVTSAERPLNHSVYAARCNDARRYNAPTSPPGGRMPLVRAILQRIATVSGPLQPTEKCVWTRQALLENWIASIRVDEGEGRNSFFFNIWGRRFVYSLSLSIYYGIYDVHALSCSIYLFHIENIACNLRSIIWNWGNIVNNEEKLLLYYLKFRNFYFKF